MKIICAGFWKTGTKSLAEALRLLGYKVYDYDDQLVLLDTFAKFFNGSITDDEIREDLKDVDVLIDGCTIAFWEEISKACPDAKVILTIRDEDSWWKSLCTMNEKMPFINKYGLLLTLLTPSGHRFVKLMIHLTNFCMGVEGAFSLPVLSFNKNNSRLYKFKYRQHNSHVLNAISEEKLLVLPVGSGWKPLCDFLSVGVPEVPYPHKNKEGAHFTTEGGPKSPAWKRLMKEMMIAFLLISLLFAYVIYYLLSYLSRLIGY